MLLLACLGRPAFAAGEAPGPREVLVRAVTQEVVGSVYHLRGLVSLTTVESELTADEIDYDEKTGDAEARGRVHFRSLVRAEELWADRAVYNVRDQEGKFYVVHGKSPAKVASRPGLLTTKNPFYFQWRLAERLK